MFSSRLLGATAALVLIVVGSTSAAARSAQFDNRPVRFWSFHEVQQGVGDVELASDSGVGGRLHEKVVFGPAVFNFPESKPRNVATGDIFSTASGKRFGVLAQAPSGSNITQRGTPIGGSSHLDQFLAYEKRSDACGVRKLGAGVESRSLQAKLRRLPVSHGGGVTTRSPAADNVPTLSTASPPAATRDAAIRQHSRAATDHLRRVSGGRD
jgi:hypothetical protein